MMSYRTFKYLGLLIFALVMSFFQWIGWLPMATARAETLNDKVVWKMVRNGVWMRTTTDLAGEPITLTYARRVDLEEFSVTTRCGYIDRTYTVSWKRGDDIGVIRTTCTGKKNSDHPIDHLESLFINLPGGAPPAKPSEVFVDDYYEKVIV